MTTLMSNPTEITAIVTDIVSKKIISTVDGVKVQRSPGCFLLR